MDCQTLGINTTLPLALFQVSKADGRGLCLGLAEAFKTLFALLFTCLFHSAATC